ncbi:ParM/StbA family protein [uncultured Clostridium sp.]|uniref:ParM/StbA family protein n=1 Tax=uncultured Clostridium sp. TaxID=59620 RepID=UPI0025EA9BCF|nr:ParM/StbA family protein [uncultured Clostridium sp.]
MKKEVYIAVDPGFDTIKVIANGKFFKFPFNTEKTDEKKISNMTVADDFILYRNKDNETWRIGQYARELIFEKKDSSDIEEKMKSFYSEKRFVSDEFTIGLRTAIAMAVSELGLYDEINNINIFIMVALPHSVRDNYSTQVKSILCGNHDYFVKIGKEPEEEYTYIIDEDNIFTVSQTVASILGETSDDDGNIDEDKFYYLSDGPTLVIDGGFYTIGEVAVDRGGSINEEKTFSDTEHAMKNINMEIAKELEDQRPDIKYYVIEYLMTKNDGKVKYLNDGKADIIDLNILKKDKIKEMSYRFIESLNKKYNNLLDFNYVLVTGGTGACYYDYLKEYYVGKGIVEEDRLILTNNILNGKAFNIEFAIAAGAYKGLKGKVAALVEQ